MYFTAGRPSSRRGQYHKDTTAAASPCPATTGDVGMFPSSSLEPSVVLGCRPPPCSSVVAPVQLVLQRCVVVEKRAHGGEKVRACGAHPTRWISGPLSPLPLVTAMAKFPSPRAIALQVLIVRTTWAEVVLLLSPRSSDLSLSSPAPPLHPVGSSTMDSRGSAQRPPSKRRGWPGRCAVH